MDLVGLKTNKQKPQAVEGKVVVERQRNWEGKNWEWIWSQHIFFMCEILKQNISQN